MDFQELRSSAGLFNSEVATLFGVSLQTVKRWNLSGALVYVTERLSMMAGIHPDWYGIRILSGELITSMGHKMSVRDIENSLYKESLLNQSLELSSLLQTLQLHRYHQTIDTQLTSINRSSNNSS